ncbi:hypothetical protein UB37_07290 [Photobacterium iliopiscarium]|uniref:HNH endonuclease n=1 Tax=Photobacterium iliopiscarium TaxID=56192 RepID=A0ABX5GSK9_9GAMM|nr:hypothetical protein [Photobacterium iliopiscarium]KJG23043.1 hypothetical protein UB37_07290 [Photobacterium iliopiscarium]PSW96668.1 hypothetical protein C9J52_09590 [Photobacterium iliopiscarium]
MKIFKLNVSDTQYFELTKDNFEKETNLQSPWYNHDGKKERHFAVCPACNNSTQIVYLYNQDKPLHAKHCLDVAVGNQNNQALQYCPHYSKKPSLQPESRRTVEDDVALEIKELLIENFDRVIYFIKKTVGIRLPFGRNKLKGILEVYDNTRGWMYSGANLINIPWIFLYQCRSLSLTGMCINKLEIRDALLNYNNKLSFDDFNRVNYPKGSSEFIELKLCFIQHKQSIQDHELHESITLKITDHKNHVIYTESISFDHDHFVNVINSDNEEYRKLNEVQLAREVLN